VHIEDRQLAGNGRRSRSLGQAGGYSARLVHYAPGLQQADHGHARMQLSFLLTGGLAEDSEGQSLHPTGRCAGLMPAGAGHAVRFGDQGALILAIDCPDAMTGVEQRRSWKRMDASLSRKVAMIGGGLGPLDDISADLLAAFTEMPPAQPEPLRRAPHWLRRAISRMVEEPEAPIAGIAAEAGIHRVHFSRIFQRHAGLSAAEFRLARKCSAAMALTVPGLVSLAQAALAAGFADQAHWTRACRALTGLPPGRIRQLFAA